jgi:hypothetical protein
MQITHSVRLRKSNFVFLTTFDSQIGLKSFSQSKQWLFFIRKGSGNPSSKIATAILPLVDFGRDTSKDPQFGHFNFLLIYIFNSVCLNNIFLKSQSLKLILCD